jgi:hypothetical protein
MMENKMIYFLMLLAILVGLIILMIVNKHEWNNRYQKYDEDDLFIYNNKIKVRVDRSIMYGFQHKNKQLIDEIITNFFIKKPELYDKKIFNNIEISVIDLDRAKGEAKKIWCWFKLKHVYVLALDVLWFHKLTDQELAGLIVHEYGHMWHEKNKGNMASNEPESMNMFNI